MQGFLGGVFAPDNFHLNNQGRRGITRENVASIKNLPNGIDRETFSFESFVHSFYSHYSKSFLVDFYGCMCARLRGCWLTVVLDG